MPSVRTSVPDRWSTERGTSLIEALVAAAIVITVAAGVAHVLLWARRSAWSAGVSSAAILLAASKMEQLRSLEWSFDAAGRPVSDTVTNLAYEPAAAGGGGLGPSPAGVLDRSTPGYVDYVDGRGQWCGTGATPPGAAAFVRRWAIEPFVTDGENTVVLSVLVVPLADLHTRGSPGPRSAHLQTIRTRVQR